MHGMSDGPQEDLRQWVELIAGGPPATTTGATSTLGSGNSSAASPAADDEEEEPMPPLFSGKRGLRELSFWRLGAPLTRDRPLVSRRLAELAQVLGQRLLL